MDVAGNSSHNKIIFQKYNLIGLLYHDPLADVCIFVQPNTLGVVLVFLVLAGNSFWCTFILSVQYSCAVVSVFGSGKK